MTIGTGLASLADRIAEARLDRFHGIAASTESVCRARTQARGDLRDLRALRVRAAGDLARELAAHRSERVASERERSERSAANQEARLRERFDRKAATAGELARQRGLRDDLHTEQERRLAAGSLHRRQVFRDFRSGFQGDLAAGRKAWRTRSALAPGNGPAPDARAGTAAQGPLPEEETTRQVLALVNSHPEGMRLEGLGQSLGLSRKETTAACRELEARGRIARDGQLFFPAR